MTTPPKIRAEVKRLYGAEHFSMNAAAQSVGIHHDTVKKIVSDQFVVKASPLARPSILDPYQHIIKESLHLYPKLRSTRILLIIKERGFTGGINTVRRFVSTLRPQIFKAYMPLNMLPGEQAQVDWAHFGSIPVENTVRKLSCFVMVLSYSRAMYVRFTFDQTMESFLRCHIEAFKYLGGVPRKILYDNLKSVVLSRDLDSIQFNPNHLEFAGHYRFKPVACNVRSGWEKGRVERNIRYIRDSFFGGRNFLNLDDGNSQALNWLKEVAHKRPWPDDRSFTVEDKWLEEKKNLLSLPTNDGFAEIIHTIRSQKMPLIRFDCNNYSIPYELVGKHLSLIASENRVRIMDSQKIVADHPRSYGKGLKIRCEDHFSGLLENRHQAATQTKQERIVDKIPEASSFLIEGQSMGSIRSRDLSRVLNLIEEFGIDDVKKAIIEASKCEKYSVNFVAQILYENMNRKVEMEISTLDLSIDHDLIALKVKHHNLSSYDSLTCSQDNETIGETI
jgi:transposase